MYWESPTELLLLIHLQFLGRFAETKEEGNNSSFHLQSTKLRRCARLLRRSNSLTKDQQRAYRQKDCSGLGNRAFELNGRRRLLPLSADFRYIQFWGKYMIRISIYPHTLNWRRCPCLLPHDRFRQRLLKKLSKGPSWQCVIGGQRNSALQVIKNADSPSALPDYRRATPDKGKKSVDRGSIFRGVQVLQAS